MFRVLAVAVAILLVLLVLRRLRVLAVPVLIGAILVAEWLLVGPLLTIPRFSTATGQVVRNGVAAIVACGKKQGMAGINEALCYADEPRTGTWDPVRRASARSGITTCRVGNSVMRATSVRRKSAGG